MVGAAVYRNLVLGVNCVRLLDAGCKSLTRNALWQSQDKHVLGDTVAGKPVTFQVVSRTVSRGLEITAIGQTGCSEGPSLAVGCKTFDDFRQYSIPFIIEPCLASRLSIYPPLT